MADQRLTALLQLRVRWVPDPTAPEWYRSESGAPYFRLRPDSTPGATRYTLFGDGRVIRELDELPAGWTVEPDYDAVAVAIEGLRHHRSEVRQTAIWRLSALGDRRALPALERTALADRGQVTVERGLVDDSEPIFPDAVDALRSLYDQLGLTAEDLARLKALLHEPAEHPNGSHHVLTLAGDALRSALRAALASPSATVVIRAARTLAELREPGAGLAQLAHPDPEVRRRAVDIGEPEAWGASWVGWPPAEWRDAVLERLSVELESAVRLRLVQFITQHCKDADAMLAVLRHCRQEPAREVRTLATKRLHWFQWWEFDAGRPDLAAEAFAWVQTESDPDLRRSLLWSAPLPQGDPTTTEWLIAHLEAGDSQARRAAATRLAAGVPDLAAEPLLRVADGPDHDLRWAALESLAKLGEPRALPKLEREIATGPLQPSQRKDLTALYRRQKQQASESRRRRRSPRVL